MKRSGKLLIVLLAVGLLASSCGRFARRGSYDPDAKPTETGAYGAGVTQAPTTKPKKLAKTGTLRIRVIDTTNRVVEGAIVRYKGPKNGKAVTDAKGVAQATVPSGTYEADIAPCGTRVVTKDYRSASIFVPRGTIAGGDLDGIGWERRFQPTPSVKADPNAPWKVGVPFEIAIRIEDRCTFAVAKNTVISEYAWKTSARFGLHAKPIMRSGADGFARATIVCRSEGNGTIELIDRTFPKKRVEATSALSVPYEGNFCEA